MIKVDGYPIDCSLNERLTYESDVTEFAVERGAPVSDHIIAKRPVFEFDGVVSDTPTGAVAEDPSRTGLAVSAMPSHDAFEFFTQLHRDRRTVSIECSFGKFEDMVLTSLSPTRDKESFKAFKFTANFRQIEFAQNNRTAVRLAAIGGAGGGFRKKLGTLMGRLKDLNVTAVISFKADASIRKEKLRQGYKLVSTTTHAQREATSKGLRNEEYADDLRRRKVVHADTSTSAAADMPGIDPFAVFGSPGRVDHYFADQTETSDGYVTGHNKQDYYSYVSHVATTTIHGRKVHWDYRTDSWVDDESNVIVEKPPKGEWRWKNVSLGRAPGPKP
jgi:hypothetical protein